MKTLEEHNNSIQKTPGKVNAGVKCDKCHTEMYLQNPNEMLLSYPAQQRVFCDECGYSGYMVVK